MTTPASIVMIGASGAVGGHVVTTLAAREDVTRLTLLGRRAIDLPPNPRTEQHVVDLRDPQTYAALLAGHTTAICTLGVGEPSAVSKEEFMRVDHDVPLTLATACRSSER